MEGLARIVGAPKSRERKAEEGLKKLVGRDADDAEKQASEAVSRLEAHKVKERKKLGDEVFDGNPADDAVVEVVEAAHEILDEMTHPERAKGTKKIAGTKKSAKAVGTKKSTTKKA